jgi:hypothetical protein
MNQFYIDKENVDVQRCQESMAKSKSITIRGLAMNGQIQVFAGIVQAMELDLERGRYRVTIRD